MKSPGSIGGDVVAAAALAGTAAVSAAEQAQGRVPEDLAELFERVPSADAATVEAVFSELVRGGPATVERLIGLVGDEFGDPQGVKPKYALHGLVHYASRPGAEAQRTMVAEALARGLAAEHSDELKAFICRQLQFCGRPEEAPALAGLLGSDRLCEPAAQALLAIGGGQAIAALRAALPEAKGKRLPTIVKALGRLRDPASAGAIRKLAGHPERDVRLTAWYALGNIGDAEAAELLLEAAEVEAPYEQTQATDVCLLLGRRLAEAGNTKRAETVFRTLLANRRGAEEVHHRAAALEGLAAAVGTRAVGDVMAALGSSDPRYRHPAARTAVELAATIKQGDPQQAERLLNKVLEATPEGAARQRAQVLLGAAGK